MVRDGWLRAGANERATWRERALRALGEEPARFRAFEQAEEEDPREFVPVAPRAFGV